MNYEDYNYTKLQGEVKELATDLEKFVERGNDAAGTRVRKQLAKIKRTCQDMRIEVQLKRKQRKGVTI